MGLSTVVLLCRLCPCGSGWTCTPPLRLWELQPHGRTALRELSVDCRGFQTPTPVIFLPPRLRASLLLFRSELRSAAGDGRATWARDVTLLFFLSFTLSRSLLLFPLSSLFRCTPSSSSTLERKTDDNSAPVCDVATSGGSDLTLATSGGFALMALSRFSHHDVTSGLWPGQSK